MFTRKPLPLPPQLQWQNKNESPLAEWSLKARAYNTDIANGIFVVFLIISAVVALWTGRDTSKVLGYQIFWGVLMFTILMSMVLSMTHQTTNFAYRLTKSGLEFCEWKEFPQWLPRVLKWAAIITGVVMLMLVMVHPAALIGAIVGPGLIGLMYLRMGTSSRFRQLHESYHHIVQSWDEFNKVTVFRRRSIIGLGFIYYNPQAEIEDKMIRSTRKLYCRKADLNKLIRIIRSQLPESTPCTEAYIPIYA